MVIGFFFNDTATTEIYTLSLHDALPISHLVAHRVEAVRLHVAPDADRVDLHVEHLGEILGPHLLVRLAQPLAGDEPHAAERSEEHTSELQSRQYLVCRLLLEKKQPLALS